MVSADSDMCNFIDQYVSCKIPEEDSKLRELVLLLQQHKHSSYCRRNKGCRFNFPKPPSSKTLITNDNAESDELEQTQELLAKIYKLIAEGCTNMSLADLLDKSGVTENEYTSALEVSCNGNAVLLQREPNKCFINPLITMLPFGYICAKLPSCHLATFAQDLKLLLQGDPHCGW